MKTLFQFGSELPGKLKDGQNGFKLRWSQDDVTTDRLPDSVKQQKRALSIDAKFYSLLRMAGNHYERKCFVGLTEHGSVAEIIEPDGTIQLVIATYKNNEWQFKAGIMGTNKTLHAYDDTVHKGSLILLALLPEILKDSEAASCRNDMEKYLRISPDDATWEFGTSAEDFSKLLCKFTNNVYYRVTAEKDNVINRIPCDLDIKTLRQNDLKKTTVLQNYINTGKIFQEKSHKKETQVMAGKYAFHERILSTQEKEMVPVMPDYYQVPAWVENTCITLQMSTEFAQPFRNILLTGPAGTGKTTGVKAMASFMGLPYCKITCSPDSDIFDFVGQMIPNTEDTANMSMDQLCGQAGIPTFEDVENDFHGSYQKLFGVEPGKLATPSDCYAEIARRLMASCQKEGKDFTYMESDLIRAVRNGYFCEIQEPTVIKRSSVLVGLNAILESEACGACYTLPTGEVVKRHPDCVICLTTNADYEGCNQIQQSVLSRMDIVRDIPNPKASELKERTMKQTGFQDEGRMLKMAEMIGKINEFCQNKDITDGVCGPRELANWAKMTLVIAKFRNEPINNSIVCQAAFTTLINKVSQIKDDAEAVIAGCLALDYSADEIDEARNNYEEGLF